MPVKLFLSPAILCSTEPLPLYVTFPHTAPFSSTHVLLRSTYSEPPMPFPHLHCAVLFMLKTLYFSGLLFAIRYSMRLVIFFNRIEGLEGWVSGWEGGVFVRQSEVTCVLHVNYDEHVPVVRLTTEEMDLVSQTVKSSFYPHFEK